MNPHQTKEQASTIAYQAITVNHNRRRTRCWPQPPKESDLSDYIPKQRFEVSHVGMSELHASRPPWTLVKELIQNSWDEAPEATFCKVDIDAHQHQDTVTVTVTDDGPGFSDITDAWTLMNPTSKRGVPTKRGRYNLGEKEIISVAIQAEVETVGKTVYFPPIGSRLVTNNQRTRGTRITIVMPWNLQQATELKAKLRQFLPTDCALIIDSETIPTLDPLAVRQAILPTVLQDGPGQPMRTTRRRTEIQIFQTSRPEGFGWLYEMGIPIQETTTPWEINISQKVPMPPNRDTVSQSYLTDVYAEVLNEMHQDTPETQFGETWIKDAMQDPRTDSEAVKSTLLARYGPKVLLTSTDANANMLAAESGYQLVNPRSLTEIERNRFREDAGLTTTYQLFGQREPSLNDLPPSDQPQEVFANWVKAMADACGLHATIRFIEEPHSSRIADCTASTSRPVVRFNVARLPTDFFSPPYGRPEQLELIYHELAHAVTDKPMEHGPAWGQAVATVASTISSPAILGATEC